MKDDILNERQEELLNQLESAEDIQVAMDVAFELIGNPIVLYDLRYKLLAHTENKVSDDPIWNEFVTTGTLSHQTVNFIKNEKFIEAYIASPVALMKSPKLKYDRANATIFGKDGLQLANICTVACKNLFEEEDFKLMEIVAKYLAEKIQKKPEGIPHVFEETLFNKLMDEAITERTALGKRIKQLHKCFKAYIYLAVIDIVQYENTLTHLVYFKELFRGFNKEFQYFIYLNNIVILFSSDKPVLNVEKNLAEFNSFFSQNSIYAGVSSGFQSLFDLKAHFKEALNALNYGLCLNSGKHIFSYDTFSIELFVNSYNGEIDMPKLCHPILFAISEYDDKNKTEYIEILYSFFISGLEHSCAAKRMNISCEEFAVYLKNAAEIFQIDWNDGNLLFSLFRSIKLLKCFPETF